MSKPYHTERDRMVKTHLMGRGISDARVLAAMIEVPREEFVAAGDRDLAYDDRAMGIGGGQTISQPFIVAYMLEQACVRAADRLLDIGTGSGYAAAVASRLAAEVHSIECVDDLAQSARERLDRLGYAVTVHRGDGRAGLPGHAPFDVIVCAAVADSIPQAWLDQLAPHGRLVAPVRDSDHGSASDQRLVRVTRGADGASVTEQLIPVRFVPLVSSRRATEL